MWCEKSFTADEFPRGYFIISYEVCRITSAKLFKVVKF